jgi:ABC-2 type transport system permease protein
MPIFDQGYQHWSGTLTGHAWRWYAIARHGYRGGMKNTGMRFMLLLAWLPAIALSFFLSIWGLMEQRSPLIQPLLSNLSFLGPEILSDPKSYRVEVWTISYSYFLTTELYFSMILILIVGPSLISQDIRFNAMPLYFSRPLRRIDYFLGKFGVIAAFLGSVLVVPSIMAYVLGLVFSLDLSIIKDTLPVLLSCVAAGAMMSLSAGLLILALSSLSRNSRYIGLFWVGVWFISSIVGTALEESNRQHRNSMRYRKVVQAEKVVSTPNAKMTAQDLQKQYDAQYVVQKKAYQAMIDEELDDAKHDWRPLVSYTGNLDRVKDALLGTNSCWEKLSLTESQENRSRFLMSHLGAQYPWQWSALVLTILFGISVCILNYRVKSLDRLK